MPANEHSKPTAGPVENTRCDGGIGDRVAVPGACSTGATGRVGALAFRPALIPNWRKAWRMLSVHVGLAAVAFGSMSPGQQTALLELVNLGPERAPLVAPHRAV